jgi:hypothetical protein
MTSSAGDTLSIANPQLYSCKVWSYLASHSQMLLRIHEGDFLTGDTFYSLFTGVQYFEGPMRWKGASFQLGTSEESLALLQKRPALVNLPERDLQTIINTTKLFKFESQEHVRILAGAVRTSKDIPPGFAWLNDIEI